MDAIRECCAGLDVHQAHVVACVLKGPLDEKPQMLIREFSTVLSGLLQLSDWLAELGCTEVAMESTGSYWKPVFNVLESTCQITLANAAHIKNLPGRKTDKRDAQWIAELHRCGLVSPSFVAPREIRELRDLTRYQRKLKGYQTSERNRILKVLEDANIKISTFMSDVFGKSGRLMLHALVNGEVIVPEQLAELAKGRLRAKIPELIQALNGRVTMHHRRMIQRSLEHLEFLERSIADLEAEMEQYFAPYQKEQELLETIPGVGAQVAKVILAEIGVDMSVFPSELHLSSWAGISPGNHESAGKKKRVSITAGNQSLKTALVEAAWAAARTRTFLSAKFWLISGRKGKNERPLLWHTRSSSLRTTYSRQVNRTRTLATITLRSVRPCPRKSG
ncbi:IS110 family RNA-guided transposase [Alicyclobacillus vulcanalis]|uniref:IS110 family transposase n=1 Tax=Alicyclobacillus vulcanalis TaxID=252246 RepID=UPI001F23C90E|nr:IS110 family transposase [Alicyclobacillus vulcanalis]